MLNKAQVIGFLGRDPEVKAAKDGRSVVMFSVATTEKGYTKQTGEVVPERTEWHNIVTFGRTAEVAQKYLHKGSKVYCEGKMRSRSFEGNDGKMHYYHEIVVDAMELLDPPSRPTSPAQAVAVAAAPAPQPAIVQPQPAIVQPQPQPQQPQRPTYVEEELPF